MAMMAFIVVSGIPMVPKVVIPEAAIVMTPKPNFIPTVRTQRHLIEIRARERIRTPWEIEVPLLSALPYWTPGQQSRHEISRRGNLRGYCGTPHYQEELLETRAITRRMRTKAMLRCKSIVLELTFA
jgi:hypothetical protein